jgi:nitrate reductase delta subunit
MALYSKQAQPMIRSLRVLAHLLSYPDATLRAHLTELQQALHEEAAIAAPRLSELDSLIDGLIRRPGLTSESRYVELFDRGRGTSLHLFEHVHGDSRDRGPAMIDLVKTYEQAGLLLGEGELPDFLPVVLQYASTQPTSEAVEFLGEIAHIVRVIFSALVKRESSYASILASVLDLAGEKAESVSVPAEPDIDETWEEPLAFGGCSTAGQSGPSATGVPSAQPVHFVPRTTASSTESIIREHSA